MIGSWRAPSVFRHEARFAFLEAGLPFQFEFAEDDFEIILIKAPGEVE
jgi:hypothetical protein